MAKRIKRSRTAYRIRIIDQTGQNIPKRVLLHQVNVATMFGETTIIWKDILLNQSASYFGFNEPILIHALHNGVMYPFVKSTNGKKYQFENGLFVESGDSSHPSEIQITNNKSSGNLTTLICRDGNVVASETITPSNSQSYRFTPTFYVQATEDLEAVVDPADANTQINYLGVKTADLTVNKSSDIYIFSLINVTYA